MLKIEVYHQGGTTAQQDLRIIYNLGSPLHVNQSKLEKFDFLLANPQETLAIKEGQAEATYALFSMDVKQLRALFGNQQLVFETDSSSSKNDNHLLVRQCLSTLLLNWSDHSLVSEAEFQRHTLDLCLLLVQHYRISQFKLQEQSQADQYRDYINQHFQDELTLAQMSEVFYMTPQYFSKHFKEQVGENFYKYVTRVRLEHSLTHLTDWDKNMLQVALESGFSTTTSFNRAFRDKYGCLPAEYRQKLRKEEEPSVQVSYQEMAKLLQEETTAITSVNEFKTVVTTQKRTTITPFWKKVINIGPSSALQLQETREQFLQFQHELSFEFARLELSFPKDFDEEYRFHREERELDFFIQLDMKLQLVIDYRQFKREPQFLSYFRKFLSHFSNRYSIQRVRQWRVELDYPTLLDEEKCRAYNGHYQELTSILKEFKMEEGLFGPGFILGDVDSFKRFIDLMEKGAVTRIQHLTFHIQPEVGELSDSHFIWKTITDQNHVSNQLEMIASYLPDDDYSIHIVEWKDIERESSWLHDSTYKAANIVKTALASVGKIADLAWNIPLDLILNEETGQLLSGLEGCISVHGIRKPSYYAHQFINRHGHEFVQSDAHSLITSSGHNLTIVSHHCLGLSSRYYLEGEEDNLASLEHVFDDYQPLSITYQLTGMKPGNYLIKTRRIHAQSGSIMELCQQVFIDGMDQVGRSEIEFLQHMTVPYLSMEHKTITDSLDLTLLLEPNEIRHTHIIYLY